MAARKKQTALSAKCVRNATQEKTEEKPMMNIEDGKIVEKLAILPNYGPIRVIGMTICRGCDKMALDIDEADFFAGNKVVEQTRILQCANVFKCSELYARLFKESGNEND